MRNWYLLVSVLILGLFIACKENTDVADSVEKNEERDVDHPSLSLLDIRTPQTFVEFETLLVEIEKENKAALVYFDGVHCVNCTKFESSVLIQEPTYTLLKKEFVIVDLDVELKQDIGNEGGYSWLDYERERYSKSIQPVFDIVNGANVSIANNIATFRSHGNPDLFAKWLQDGL